MNAGRGPADAGGGGLTLDSEARRARPSGRLIELGRTEHGGAQ